mmetsp:Transcript_8889/g.29311  ORF Transcript_8889/g.29311 Transcript_8889/m.29311 type:complete len:266 (-) Transcript_8889:230-1027(-)
MSPRRRQRCRREREKGSRAHRSGRGDAAEPAARQLPFLQPSGAVVSVGRPLTLTGEVLPVCHGRKLSLLSLRPRGGREAWESFAGLIGPLPFPFHRWSTTHQTKRPPRGVGVFRRPDRPSFRQVNETLYRQGYATVHDLQLLRVDFNSNYEDTITNIQLQEQLKVTKTYQLEVTRVSKEVDILSAEAEAAIARINAQAQREASVTINQASAAAIQMEQGAKATWYAKLKATLGWSNDDFLRYVKIKSLNAQPGGSVVIGVDAVGG